MAASRWVVAVAGVMLVAGCSSMKVGRNFDYDKFGSQVQQGVTDAGQVRDWLGEPVGRGVEVTPEGNRLDVWTYYAGRAKVPSGSDVSFKMLQVKFTPEGKVVGYVWSGELAGAAVEDKSAAK